MASLLMCVSAFGQYSVTQSAPITINDAATASPYPSSIYLTNANLIGSIERVTVTVNNLSHPYAPDIGMLLVGPGGQAVVLMSGSGGNPSGSAALDKAMLTFSDSASGSLPISSPLISGNAYKPTDNANLSFPSPAPSAGYATTLAAAFGGGNPNGVWSLYVLDDQAGPPTTMTPSVGSWTLNLYTTPLVSASTNTVYLSENGSPVTVNLTLSDSSPPANGFVVTVANGATNLVNATASVSGASGTLTITPSQNTFGTNTLTVVVSDGIGTAQTDITVKLAHVNQAPTLTVTNSTLSTVAGTISPTVNVVVADVDPSDTPGTLALDVSSSDTNLVAPSGIFFSSTDTGALRKFAVVPVGTNTGTATLTMTVIDSGGLSNSTTLTLNVQAVAHPIFASTQVLGLGAAGLTNSGVTVTNIAGALGNVTVSVSGLKTITPNNLGLALVAPGGSVTLLNNSGGAGPNSFGQVTFSSGGSASLPANDTITPVPVTAAGLASLVGSNPNGTWTLWATNGGAGAQVADGWVLNLLVAPTISSTVTNISIPEEGTANIAFTVASIDGTITNVSNVTVTSGNTDLLTIVNPTFDLVSGKGAAQLQAIFKTTGPQYGPTTVTVTATDNNNFTTTFTYNINVTFVNHAPSLSFIGRQVARAGTVLGPISFTVSDPDLPAQTLTVTGTSDNQTLLPDSNILIQNSGRNFTFTLFPLEAAADIANVTLVVSDGTTTSSETFEFDLLSQGNPLFASQKQITLPANAGSIPYPTTVTVSNLLGTISDVTVTLFDITHSFSDNLNLLLVSPQGTAVQLMGHAGGGNALANTTLVFSDAGAPLPDSAQITSGTYAPTNYSTVASFPTPAPVGPFPTLLSTFNGLNGTNANGTWSLYAVDDGSGKGVVLNGWQLSIQTLPSVQPIANVTMAENSKTLQIPVNVGDDQPGVNISVSAVSANTGVVQASFESGSGGTRTLDITPVPYQIGSNITVTVTATSGSASSQNTFQVTVYQVGLSPVVSSVADVTTLAASQSPVTTFTVWDPQDSSLTVNPSSGDTKLLPNGNISLTGPVAVGATNGHTIYQYGVSALPAGILTGSTTISLAIKDAAGQSASAGFNITVSGGLVYMNQDGPISIPEGYPIASNSTPFPSVISVSNLNGNVTGVGVTLVGFSHAFPQDVDILLVTPDNSKGVVLMAHAGGSTTVNGLRLSFADGAASLPFGSALANGAYAPSDYAGSLTFAAPAPTSGYTTNLASLVGSAPNGNWKLYVMDDSFPLGGSLDGWILSLQTGPAFDLSTVGPQTTAENTPLAVSFNLLDSSMDPSKLVVTASTNGPFTPTNLLNLVASLQVTNNGGATRTLIITPSPNLPSAFTNVNATATIQLTVTDTNNNTSTTSFPLTVVYSNQPPVLATATNSVYLSENGSITVTYTLSDVDSTLYTSNLVVNSTDSSLVPNSTNNIVVNTSTNRVVPGATGTVTIQVTPAAYASGTNTLTVAISDGIATTTSVLNLNVGYVEQGPVISGLPNPFNAPAGGPTAPIQFTVSSPDGVAAKLLTVTATSQNQGIVPNANIVLGGSADIRTIQLTPLGTVGGSNTITLKVGDGSKTNSFQFVVNFTPPPVTLFGNGQTVNIVGTTNAVNASVYPISFTVTNLVGGIFDVSLEMRGFSNNVPSDFDALLVSPDGIAVVLMSGAGGTVPVGGLDIEFDDSGATMGGVLTNGTYHPAYYTKRLLPAPAPQSGYQSRLSAFSASTSINGTWQLFVNNPNPGDFGQIAGGCFLTIVTRPSIQVASVTPVVIPENGTGTINFSLSDSTTAVTNLTLTAASDNSALLPAASPNVVIQAVSPGVNNNYTATLKPASYVNGTAHLTLTAARADGASASTNITVSVTATNFPSVISRLLPQSTPENTPITVEFLVSDVDTALSSLSVKAVSDTQGVIGDSNLVFLASGSNSVAGLPPSGVSQVSDLKLSIQPNSFAVGSATISIIVTDSTTNGVNVVTSNFVVTVAPVVYNPTLSAIPDQTLTAGSNIVIGFTVNSQNQGSPTLAVSATSSDQSIVKTSNLIITPASASGVAGRTLQITAEQNAKGPTTITLVATDTSNGNKTSTPLKFTLTVLPTPVHTFSNPNLIVINDNAPASPYAATNVVSGLQGKLSAVSVSLNGFGHHYPSDVGVLLVSPSGQSVVLMDRAGGGTSVTNLNLAFSQTASGAIPQGSALSSGTFKPADYNSPSYNYPAPAPQHPYPVDLTTLNAGTVNGPWLLYVVDQSPPDAGAISNGWSLTITTTPQINGLGNLTISENSSGSQAFTIGDDSPSGPSYRFGVASTNTALIPNANITVAGAGTNYTVTLTPAANVFGTNLVTVWATNIDNMVASSTFLVTVPQVIQPPFFAPIANQTVAAGSVANITLNYGDIQVAQNQLKVSYQSSDLNLVPLKNISLSGNVLQITPAGGSSGSSVITITLTQPAPYNLSTNVSFTLTVTPTQNLFGNTDGIIINDRAPSTPYPSTINVSNVVGNIVKATVSVRGLAHTYPSDISMLLVGPRGQEVVLISRAGSGVGSSITNVDLTFDDSAEAGPVQSGLITSGTYKPSDYNGSLAFYSPAPAGPYVTNLSAFKGTSANGAWQLWVQDDLSPDSGVINGDWLLSFVTTAPMVSSIGPVTTPENTPTTVQFTVSSALTSASNLTVTAISSNSAPAGLVSGLTVTGPGTNAAGSRTLLITPAVNLPSAVTTADGTTTIILTITDGTNSSAVSFPLTVTFVNQAPTLSGLSDQTTPANAPLSVAFMANDVDTAASNLMVTASSSVSSLGALALSGNGNAQTLKFTPNGTVGATLVTVIVSDGQLSATNSFHLTVTPAVPPVIAAIPDTNTFANLPVVIPLSVTYAAGQVTNLSFTATETSNIVSGVTFAFVNSQVVATVNLAKNALGTSLVTITASDAFTNGSQSFTLEVQAPEPPELGNIADQSTKANKPLSVSLNVTSPATPISNLTFTATSSNPSLVSGITFANDGVKVAAMLNPAQNQVGQAVITVFVSDGFSTASNSFNLTVTAPAPATLGSIAAQSTQANKPVVLPLSVTSPDTAITNLFFTGASTNSALVSGFGFAYNGTTEVATINLVANKSGDDAVTLSVSDAFGQTNSVSFSLHVSAITGPTVAISVVNGKLQLTFAGSANATYGILSSTDLKAWSDTGLTVTTDATGAGSTTIALPAATGKTFYRAVVK